MENRVIDTDSYFQIDPTTREITNTCGKKTVNQYDHNSERYTFGIPKIVDGFDMLTCNVVEIHFTNTNYKDKTELNKGIYEADDLRVCPDDPDIVLCSWLISENATQLPGTLHFQVKYKLVDADGKVIYRWQTKTYKKVTVNSSIENGSEIAKEYPDVLAQFDSRLDALEEADAKFDSRLDVLEETGGKEETGETDAKYFKIDDNGLLSLKDEYRGLGGSGYDYSKSNNGFGVEGSLIAELPENIVIPEVVNEIAVNALAPAMFYQNNRVKRLTIPSFITEIPERFCDRAKSIEQIDGTENVEIIGKAAFQQTKLKKVVFPKLKAALETATFGACYYLVSADIGNDITELPKNCFRYCERLSSIRGGASVSKIGQGTLEFTLRLKKIPFADKLTEIGKEGLYLSRVNYDWSQHSATYFENATYAHYKSPYTQTNFWTGYWDTHTVTPCEIPLRTMFNQLNPQWLVDAEQAGFTGLAKTDWPQNCALMVYAAMYSFYEQKDLSSPVEYMCAVREANPDALNVHPGHDYGPDHWMKPLGYNIEYVTFGGESAAERVAAVEKIYQALSEGKLVKAKVVSAEDPGAGNHAVLLYGINSSGEVLVFNPGNYSSTVGDYRPFTYAMPLQNMIPAGARFNIVSKEG